jgi:hypothetical protein
VSDFVQIFSETQKKNKNSNKRTDGEYQKEKAFWFLL